MSLYTQQVNSIKYKAKELSFYDAIRMQIALQNVWSNLGLTTNEIKYLSSKITNTEIKDIAKTNLYQLEKSLIIKGFIKDGNLIPMFDPYKGELVDGFLVDMIFKMKLKDVRENH